jgi:hypothetical protein
MKFRDFLPFEISYIDSEKTIDEIINILLAETDKTLLLDFQKRYRGKFNESNIHLWDNIILLRRQHYYFEFLKTDENKTKVKIFSRNNAFFIFAYIFFMIVGIYGLIKMIIMKNYIGILFLILWILFIFILTNFIHKKSRKEEIIFIERVL